MSVVECKKRWPGKHILICDLKSLNISGIVGKRVLYSSRIITYEKFCKGQRWKNIKTEISGSTPASQACDLEFKLQYNQKNKQKELK
jgi:hypothetical protein